MRFVVSHPTQLDRATEVELLVDTGAMISFVPRHILEQLGVPVQFQRRFRLPNRRGSGGRPPLRDGCGANGQLIQRDVGTAFFRWNSHVSGAAVAFGEPGDEPILGVTALEAMGLDVDPTRGTLKPTDTLLV